VSIFIMVLAFSCVDKKSIELDFLVGTWKRENKELYEVWEKNKSSEINGHSFIIKDNKKTITETLVIKKIDNQFVYEATVPDQNEGITVQFTLNTEADSILSFENDKHDFPKKIQYRKINNNQIEVSVLGEEDNSFSYIQVRQLLKQ